MSKTIKQLADELGVSKPTIAKVITDLHLEPIKIRNRFELSDSDCNLVKAQISQNGESQKSQISQSGESQKSQNELQKSQISMLETQISLLQGQLTVKDEQLAAKDEQIKITSISTD